VGSVFRTADAVGADMIYLIGTTPTPVDRFGRKRKDVIKTSLGAEETVNWKYSKTITPIISKLKKQGFIIISLEQNPKSIPYTKVSRLIKNKDIALIIGNEVDGVSQKALIKSDYIIEIPMKGIKESLNVSVATGIALYRILDK
jgi:tRNA G18 (ribose-2'-O)-methylase SpoU